MSNTENAELATGALSHLSVELGRGIAMSNKYPLDVKSVGDDVYILMSKGHHDPHKFMKKVKEDDWTWPMGMPTHHWVKSVPSKEGTRYHFVKEGTHGAWPATYSHEAYGEDVYRHTA